ncbi:hypothetical protein NC653_039130 [Populus alba x Populus x berolinensis]|uniref:Uncharacterized protein n=1 Tax=Populus alba x Populus x berolinensis TaxID=444605 RepID=A0AAD6LC13_9ROSI|nr:hypothetical protein NC653_039102 [Populus alba x Populus x berolinensis]KAJ6957108.1 hypothetical protein NC653_039130 [Populus alba x Populus x berolinensis]
MGRDATASFRETELMLLVFFLWVLVSLQQPFSFALLYDPNMAADTPPINRRSALRLEPARRVQRP